MRNVFLIIPFSLEQEPKATWTNLSATSEKPLTLQNRRGENLHTVKQLFSASQENKKDEKLNTDTPDKVGWFVA